MANLYSVPLENGVQLTLQNALLAGETTSITFTGTVTSKLQASVSMPGILVIDRVDINGDETPTKTEYISFTGVTGSTVTGLVRGLSNTSDQDHGAGAIVEFVPDVVWAEALNDVFTTQHNADGTHKPGISLASTTIITSNIDTFSFKNLNAPEGFLINGKIVPSVASNNLTVALKTLAGNDPSASDPVYVRIGDVIRTITSALSVDAGAGTNWLLAGTAETAGKEIDFFVYIGVKTSDSSLALGFARIPYANSGADFATTGSSEKYCRMTGAEFPGDFGAFVNIGRFAATLSASPSNNWSVPTFNSSNLIQRPIYETRHLDWQPTYSASGSMTWTSTTTTRARYQIRSDRNFIVLYATGTTGGTASTELRATLPFSAVSGSFVERGAGAVISTNGISAIWIVNGNSSIFFRYDAANYSLAAGNGITSSFNYQI